MTIRFTGRAGRAVRRVCAVAIVAACVIVPERIVGARRAMDEARTAPSSSGGPVAVPLPDGVASASAAASNAAFTPLDHPVRHSRTTVAGQAVPLPASVVAAVAARRHAAAGAGADVETGPGAGEAGAATVDGRRTTSAAVRKPGAAERSSDGHRPHDGSAKREAPAGARRTAGTPSLAPTLTAFRQSETGWSPASPSVAAGGGFVLAAANASFDVWRTNGNRARTEPQIALADWFDALISAVPPEFDLSVASPQVVHDPATGRFVLAAVAWPKDASLHWPVVLLSVSDTSDPTGGWCSHFVGVGHDEDGTNNAVFERLSLAMTRRGLVLLSNLIAHQGEHEFRFAAARVHVLPAGQLFGSTCQAVETDEIDLIADDNDDFFDRAILAANTPPIDGAFAVGSRAGGGNALRVWPIALAADGSIAGVVSGDVPVPAYDVPPDAHQPGTSVPLSTGGAEIRSAVLRGTDIWAVQSIDHGDRAGVGWYRVNATDPSDNESGRFNIGDADDTAFPTIVAAPECDNAYVLYSLSGPDKFASVGLTDIRGDAAFRIAAGTGCIAQQGSTTARWGAQTGAAIDPSTGLVWSHAAFATGTSSDCTSNGWATALVAVDWDICDTAGPGPTPTTQPDGDRGIGFALASKRYMRGVYNGGGLNARQGGMAGTANTGIQVQNTDGRLSASPSLNLAEQFLPYETPSRQRAIGDVEMRAIPPGASLNAYLPSLNLADAMYRVTITTPRNGGDIRAILRTDWDSGAAAVVSDLNYAGRVVIPHVARNYRGHTSVIALDNANAEAISLTVQFFRAGSGAAVASMQVNMDPTEALTFDLNDSVDTFRALGDGFRGTAIIDAGGAFVGAQVYEYVESSALAVGGFEGIPAAEGSRRLFVPLFRSQQYGPGGIRLNTAIAVANAGDSEASVTVSYHPTTNESASGACRSAGVVRHGPVRIPPSTNFVFDQGPGGGHGLPENCFGSAVVETASSGDTIVATVLDTQNADETLSMINASPVEFASKKVALPLFRSRHLVAAYTTGIQVMNTSDRAANVHIDFSRSEGNETFPIGGCRGQCDAIIRPFEAYTWWPPAVAAIPSGTYGAAVISSDEPIVVLVNDYPLAGNSDMATYAGIPVLTQP